MFVNVIDTLKWKTIVYLYYFNHLAPLCIIQLPTNLHVFCVCVCLWYLGIYFFIKKHKKEAAIFKVAKKNNY